MIQDKKILKLILYQPSNQYGMAGQFHIYSGEISSVLLLISPYISRDNNKILVRQVGIVLLAKYLYIFINSLIKFDADLMTKFLGII